MNLKINEDWLATILAFVLLGLALIGVIGPSWSRHQGTGIYVEDSNALVVGNSLSVLQNAIVVDEGSYNVSLYDTL